jgi:glycosyltransferase involved in cell wall biosynthesis
MRVGVDGRHLGAGRGVARYVGEALAALAAGFPEDEWIAFVPGGAPVRRPDPAVQLVRHPLPSRALFGSAALVGRPRLDRLLGGGLDVVWAPAPAPLALSPAVPLVLTIHDRSFEARRRDFRPYERLWHALARPRELAARAAIVVTDGAAIRDELLAAGWPVDRARVRVVPPGPGLETREGGAPEPHPRLPERYVLFVGALEPRKAPYVLAEAFARARGGGLDADLILVGAGRVRLDGPGIHRLGPVDDEVLDALYAGALALVLPSWVEGFGMPPLEAALRGTPSVVSDLPALREALGPDGAVYVAPGDAGALAAALLSLAGDAALRERVARAAGEAADELSWRATAEGLHAALAEAAGR